MAKTQGPLMSLGASGSIAKTLTFAIWKGRPYVRHLVNPANPKSPAQIGSRAIIAFLAQSWSSLLTADQTAWDLEGKKSNFSGINAYSQKNGKRHHHGAPPIKNPGTPPGAPPAAPTGGAVTSVWGQNTITWVDPVTTIFGVIIHRDTTTGFTPAPNNVVGYVLAGVLKFVDAPLPHGVTQYYRIAAFEPGGTLGAYAAEISGTPL